MAESVTFAASDLTAFQIYDLMVATIVPRPIALVSTLGAKGVCNLAPFSFFMAGGSNPPSLAFSPTLGVGGEEKDTLRNIVETKEFVVNTVHRAMADGMNQASARLAPSESEWPYTDFSPRKSLIVAPPGVSESLVSFECRLFQVVEHGHEITSARYVIGEIVMVHVASALMSSEDHVDPELVHLVARLGGPNYLDMATMERFSMARPG